MSYVRKLMAPDERLIGIARLHWIYVIKGIFWFFIMAGAGWLFNEGLTRAMMSVGEAMENNHLPATLSGLGSSVMFFLMAGGFFVFFLFVLDVLTTEIGLSEARVMHKRGWIFVKVRQIDIEEVRGENLDLGYFGKFLGYGYILLDCRFIGDVKLPAIENPERFMRALHDARTNAQDTLQMVLGKSNVRTPVQMVAMPEAQQDPQPKTPKPEIQPGQPGTQPEVQPDPVPTPEIRPEPTPHAPPPPSQPPAQPDVPPPQPQQPIPNPGPNPQPPLQPPGSPAGANARMDPNAVAQVVAQVTPHIAQKVVEQLKEQGVIQKPPPGNDNDIDNKLVAVFDDARFKDADPHALHDKMEHIIH
jgi:hypothetical protein